MAKTQHFGLNKFGPEGRLSDEGHKFTLKDRDLIDSLLFALTSHNHSSGSATSRLPGPGDGAAVYLELEVDTTGGTLLAGRDYYYKFSYVDEQGNETAASPSTVASTPLPITSPESQSLSTSSTGGTLEPGTYRYSMSFYQNAGGETTASNVSIISVPTGTSTNTVTIPLETLPEGADGWKVYRQAPGEVEYYLLDTVASGATEYVDDGTVSPDCTKRRPLTNTTNSTNSIIIDLPASELPLDSRIQAWRIYRSRVPGSYTSNSLVATVVETTTEGGGDIVTTYTDTGGSLSPGIPLQQTSVPEVPPALDASLSFDSTGGRLPSELAPQGVHAFNLLLPGTLAAQTYHQISPPYDMPVERIDAYYLTAPTGLSAGVDYLTVRFSDDATQNEIQSLYNDAQPYNEIQSIYNDGTAGTFTLSDGVDDTTAIDFDATADTIETRLETDIASITDVTVVGSGTQTDPWIVTFVDPGATNVTQLTADDTNLTGVTTITTLREGQDGGTFTLSDGTDTTSAIDFNADAATITTRLETDITSITDVTVTGTGTFADPWLIEFVDPGSTDVDYLFVDDTNLDGNSYLDEEQRGHGPTQVDLIIDQNQASHSWQSSTTPSGTQEAEDAPATGDGVEVSDSLAINDTAMELDAQNDEQYWNVGTLDPGDYVVYFWVADVDRTGEFDIAVVDDHLGTPTTLESRSLSPARSVYTPAYELRFTSTGAEDLFFVVTKTDADTDRIRVDKWEYEFQYPVLSGNVTAEVFVTGSPTTNGDDLQLTLWY